MQKMITGAALALALASLPAFAQTAAPAAVPTTPASPPAATMPAAAPARAPAAPVAVQAAKLDPAVEAKFKAIDKDNNGALEGAELSTFKDTLAKIDTNKDGKVSRDEFAAATKGGVIK
jgi:hypothetical protein